MDAQISLESLLKHGKLENDNRAEHAFTSIRKGFRQRVKEQVAMDKARYKVDSEKNVQPTLAQSIFDATNRFMGQLAKNQQMSMITKFRRMGKLKKPQKVEKGKTAQSRVNSANIQPDKVKKYNSKAGSKVNNASTSEHNLASVPNLHQAYVGSDSQKPPKKRSDAVTHVVTQGAATAPVSSGPSLRAGIPQHLQPIKKRETVLNHRTPPMPNSAKPFKKRK